MELRITKNTGKPHIVLYKRNDGTSTWMHADDFFVRHDLSHYAIEKTLGYTTAFMGMLNNGMDIKDFENRDKRKLLTITKEAWYAENMANLFLIESAQGNFDDFNGVAVAAFTNRSVDFPPPELSAAAVDTVRDFLRKLVRSWDCLPAGETMLLTF
jgi:hypothetical protein